MWWHYYICYHQCKMSHPPQVVLHPGGQRMEVPSKGVTGQKTHTCPFCPYESGITTNLQKHIRTHTGEKPFACPHCSYRSNCNDHLKRHILIHTGEKPYSCTMCSYRSTHKSNVKSHMFSQHQYQSWK